MNIISIIIIILGIFLIMKNRPKKRVENDFGDSKFEQKCINCHYLMKSIRQGGGPVRMPLTPIERQELLDNRFEFIEKSNLPWELGCYKNIWSREATPDNYKELYKNIVEKKRKNKCDFVKYEQGKNFEDIGKEDSVK
ncbi:hypothetical protein HLVA_21160 (plasmid) [Haliovirga abyssi]|uniref:Cytochrome c domain-containing protein n=2 Tax=Haliovirga abyssi TaxID=2996794 RepID=A0AAU9DIV7_9FUSO|nr:hypothetical protein HLVA_21160 [Haliovirga abyssi]